MNTTQIPARSMTTPQWARDAYRFPALPDDLDQQESTTAVDAGGDYLLAAPDPMQRLPFALPAPDMRRLDLHAALTTSGVAPLPGDLAAIHVLCELDDATVATVLRWITSTG
ncbi:hypothetical protein [Streptomyces sp. NBC_00829]|uniref:hypothetical protein n=1 Tax=Streptomyces sp. NBC_00829 TaxID=2903679 RepID=UPI0038709A1A|nr:hypothetical protein OG293_02090 [Streptomyces sp. NBC_00829]